MNIILELNMIHVKHEEPADILSTDDIFSDATKVLEKRLLSMSTAEDVKQKLELSMLKQLPSFTENADNKAIINMAKELREIARNKKAILSKDEYDEMMKNAEAGYVKMLENLMKRREKTQRNLVQLIQNKLALSEVDAKAIVYGEDSSGSNHSEAEEVKRKRTL